MPSDQNDADSIVTDHVWYMRPVFFVSHLQNAIGFYVDKLGFIKRWHEGDGEGTVCQVDRGGCEIILCQDTTRLQKSRVLLELSKAAVDQLFTQVNERAVPARKDWWRYEVLRIEDTDGNELLICLENLL